MSSKSFLAVHKPVYKTQDELAELLDSTAVFRNDPWHRVRKFAACLDFYEVKPGIELFAEGDPAAFMAIIVAGSVAVEKGSDTGKRQRLSTLTKGKVLGEMAMIDNQPRSAAVVTTERSSLLILTKEKFDLLLNEQPDLANTMLLKIAGLLSARLRQTSGRLVDLIDEPVVK